MTPERWKRTEELYHAATVLPAAERTAFLAEACADDEALRRDLESLLREAASDEGAKAGALVLMSPDVVPDPSAAALTGRVLGGYHIQTLVGTGGMGEVYAARDLTLGRDVAIKILPVAFTNDANRLARFEREARMLAALNHPNVCAIHGLEESEGIRFLVLELVNGKTLAQAIADAAPAAARGGLPLREALTIAAQITEALEAAHEKGIIHRDLKPANITITPDGMVKVLDFGLAKAIGGDGASPDLTHLSAAKSGESREGVMLGTAAYMSPEQARGKPVDTRTDIWSFGCVLYEMLSGRVAFAGETVSDTIARILEREPDWTALPDELPARVHTLLGRCLKKESRQRLQAIGDARIEIEEVLEPPGSERATRRAGVSRLRWSERVFWITAAAVLTLAAAGALNRARRPTGELSETRLEITTPPTTDPGSLAISPDGQKVVFSAAGADGRAQLWIRWLSDVSARPMAATDGARYPFWSPDSRSVGFFANGRLKRIDAGSGLVREIADATLGLGGSWNSADTIVFAPNWVGPLRRVAAAGGAPVDVTRLDAQQSGHRFPQFLPDGRHFLFESIESGGIAGVVYLGDTEGGEVRRLVESGSAAAYARSGHLLFARGGPAVATLMAQRFDGERLQLQGQPFPIADAISAGLDPGSAALSVSASGLIAYRADSGAGQRQFVWFDRAGKEIGKLGSPDGATSLNPVLSPDGRHVAVRRSLGENTDIWLLDTRTGLFSRLTSTNGLHNYPVWSSDNRYVAYSANLNRAGVNDLYRKALDGTENEELVLSTSQNKGLSDWSSDGRFLLYRSVDPRTGNDLWALSLADRKSFPVVQTTFDERDGQFSPDGRWIAYQSNETGSFEIWARPFPEPGTAMRISTDGGAQIRWRRDGKELFYIGMDGRLMAVPIQFGPGGETIEAGRPEPLFATRIGGAFQGNNRHQYVVAADGQRFLMNTVMAGTTSTITIIQHWKARPD